MHACLASVPLSRWPRLGATAASLRLCQPVPANSFSDPPSLESSSPYSWSPRFQPSATRFLLAVPGLFGGLTVVRLVCSGRGVEWSGGIKWARVSFNRIAALWPVAFGSCVTAYLRSCYCVLLCTLLFALNESEETRIIVTVHTIRETRQISHSKT